MLIFVLRYYLFLQSITIGNTAYVTGPAKIGHVGSQNLTKFQNSGSYKILFQHGTAIKKSELVENIFGFTTLLTESKYQISELRYVLSNDMF